MGRLARSPVHALLWAALLCAGCEPQARRALVLDLALADPALLDGTARPWRDAGYTVEYRRFYPHVALADVSRYHTLVILLGQEPEAPSDALTTGDLAMLSQALRTGAVVVVGYSGDGTGSLDRWTINRWLASEGAGIGIGDAPLEDTTASFGAAHPQPWAAGQRIGEAPLGSVYEPFPFERNHPLAVRRSSQVLAVASRHAFVRTARSTVPRPAAPIVAAVRVGEGLVVVLSRHALGTLEPQAAPTTAPLLELGALEGTQDFLTALARWTRRPAQWAHVPPAEHPTSLTLAGAPRPVELAPAPPAAPPGAATEPLAPPPADPGPVGVPSWVRQAGMRALWIPLLAPPVPNVAVRPPVLDSLVGFLDEAGLNLLIGDADPQAIADSLHHRSDERSAVRRAWSDIVTLLQPTSVAWIPGLAYWPARVPPVAGDSSRDTRGDARGVPCALDSAVWSAGVAPAFTTLARLAGGERQFIPALALELEAPGSPPDYSMGQEFCDVAWRTAAPRLSRQFLDSVPRTARYQRLRDQGLLGSYYQLLEQAVADRARALRDRALREHPGLYFAVRLEEAPGDWFTLGVLRGFSLPDRPLLLFTPETDTRSLLAAYRARGLNMVHAVELPTDILRPRNLPTLKRLVFGANDGFWLGPGQAAGAKHPSPSEPLASDSVANVLRRLTR
ncbi:MAG TPA: hypothetical protein VN848_04065 [Gemmatimonadales bacterium]|nr:hypothetical protein [Gemmatimonadales bacterium]